MSMLEIIILSLIQGFTEFLPISSSAHLIFPSKIFQLVIILNKQKINFNIFFSKISFFFFWQKSRKEVN